MWNFHVCFKEWPSRFFCTVPEVSFHRFRLIRNGDQLSRLLDEGRRKLEADGHRLVRSRYFLDEEGRQRSFPATANCVETAEEVGGPGASEATDQVEPHNTAGTLWVLSDPLDDDFRRTVESSLVLHIVGGRGLSRGGSFVRHLTTVHYVGELRSRVLEKLDASNPGRQAVHDNRLCGARGGPSGPSACEAPAGVSLFSRRVRTEALYEHSGVHAASNRQFFFSVLSAGAAAAAALVGGLPGGAEVTATKGKVTG